MVIFKKKSQRREANMNESSASDDVCLNRPSTSTKPKNPDLWKHLKQKCWRRGKKGKRCGNTVHIMEANVNKCPASDDVGLNQALMKQKKSTVWQRLKQKCGRREKTEKGCGDVKHTINVEPRVATGSYKEEHVEPRVATGSNEEEHVEPRVATGSNEEEHVEPPLPKGSFKEESPSDAVVKAYLDSHRHVLDEYVDSHLCVLRGFVHDNIPIETLESWITAKQNAKVKSYLDSHRHVLHQYFDRHLSVLRGFVHENVPVEVLEKWIAAKQGCSLNQIENDEGADNQEVVESNEFHKVEHMHANFEEDFEDHAVIQKEAAEMELPHHENIDAVVKAYLDSHRHVLDEYVDSHLSVLRGFVHDNIPIETLESCITAKQNAKVKSYLDSHRHVLHQYFDRHVSVLRGFVHENVPVEVLEKLIAAKQGCSLIRSKSDEGADNEELVESNEFYEDEHMYTDFEEEFEDHAVIKNWEVISKIGEGGFGYVYKAKNVNSAEEVALKKAKYMEEPEIQKEAAIMKLLHHENIVRLIDLHEDPILKQVVLVMEYVNGDSLEYHLALCEKFSEKEARPYMAQMACAFAYLHSQNTVHRDVKLQNVLCSSGVMKVIDFRLAEFFTQGVKLHEFCGTSGYMAPEISEAGYEGPPVDVWSLGILATKLFSGSKFDGSNIVKRMPDDKTNFNVVYNPPTLASEPLVSLLTGMLQKNPMERLTMQEIVNHTWFKEN